MINNTSPRIDVADVLRGFAVFGIVLLHSIEHFNFYSYPEVTSQWLKFTDTIIWDSLFFTFGGKAYAIFALLFGFSFFIQDDNQLQRGYDFRLRFVWRLFLLFIWGNINAMFFTGEILVLYSIVGLVLVLTARLSTKTSLIIAIILLLQPMEWAKIIYALLNPDYEMGQSMALYYFMQAMPVQTNGNFIEMVKVNLWEGQLASLTWAWENARFFQAPALFILGMLIGKTGLFLNSEKNIKFWSRALIISIVCFFPLNGLKDIAPDFITNDAVLVPLVLIIKSFANFAFMTFLISLIIIMFYKTKLRSKLMMIVPYGRMSLTMYISQSAIGAFVFYNWGLGMYSTLGITYSLLVGIGIFVIQYIFSYWWLKSHKQGPLEYIWKKATWIGAKRGK